VSRGPPSYTKPESGLEEGKSPGTIVGLVSLRAKRKRGTPHSRHLKGTLPQLNGVAYPLVTDSNGAVEG